MLQVLGGLLKRCKIDFLPFPLNILGNPALQDSCQMQSTSKEYKFWPFLLALPFRKYYRYRRHGGNEIIILCVISV